MVGPAPLTVQGERDVELGDSEGNVPLAALAGYQWLYESDYYKSLIDRAKLTNPTALVSSGESIEIEHVCVHRTFCPASLLNNTGRPTSRNAPAGS